MSRIFWDCGTKFMSWAEYVTFSEWLEYLKSAERIDSWLIYSSQIPYACPINLDLQDLLPIPTGSSLTRLRYFDELIDPTAVTIERLQEIKSKFCGDEPNVRNDDIYVAMVGRYEEDESGTPPPFLWSLTGREWSNGQKVILYTLVISRTFAAWLYMDIL